jgi:medium-chain acyl-[acyl-carrier-protein] hydrolase
MAAAVPEPSPWLPFGCGAGDAAARLFCFPFAGGGASNFMPWRRRLPGIGVAPVQYPGRETRLDEPPARDLAQAVAEIAGALAPWLDRPYLLLGTSLGAKVAYAVALRLRQLGLPGPRALLVAAHVPPGSPSASARLLPLPDEQFLAAVQAYGGLPGELLESAEFRAMILPVLRADFALAHQAVELAPLACPIHAFAGTLDRTASAEAMQGWQHFTRAGLRLTRCEGGHFFFRDAPGFEAALAGDIALALAAEAIDRTMTEMT